MNPSEVISLRGELYRRGEYAAVYRLYSADSELRRFFTSEEDYTAHVRDIHSPCNVLVSLIIEAERVRGALADITHTERFIEHGRPVSYITRSILKLEDGGWKILRESRTIAPCDTAE